MSLSGTSSGIVAKVAEVLVNVSVLSEARISVRMARGRDALARVR
jgi:hypothetical protein